MRQNLINTIRIKQFLYKRAPSASISGFGIVEAVLLILIIGIIMLVIINGMTTTALVVKEVNDRDRVIELGKNYLNNLYEKAKDDSFYESIETGSFPPVPAGSVYTDAGNYDVQIDVSPEENNSRIVRITFRKPADTSFSKPVAVLEVKIEDPDPET